MLTAGAFAQQTPVTRAEFAGVFSQVAAGFVSPGAAMLPPDFPKDGLPVSKADICRAMLLVALGGGSGIKLDDPLPILRSAKILPEDARLFTQAGDNFRPDDLIAVLIAFTEGMANRHQTKSATEPSLRKPGGGGDNRK